MEAVLQKDLEDVERKAIVVGSWKDSFCNGDTYAGDDGSVVLTLHSNGDFEYLWEYEEDDGMAGGGWAEEIGYSGQWIMAPNSRDGTEVVVLEVRATRDSDTRTVPPGEMLGREVPILFADDACKLPKCLQQGAQLCTTSIDVLRRV